MYFHVFCLALTGRLSCPIILEIFGCTGGSRLSRTAVKPDSRLAQIFCIISFLYNLINLMQISTDKPDN